MPRALIELEDGRKVEIEFDQGGAAPGGNLDQTVRNVGRGIAQGASATLDQGLDLMAGAAGGIGQALDRIPSRVSAALDLFPGFAGARAGARAARGMLPAGGVEGIVDRNIVSLEPEGAGGGFRTGQSIGRGAITLPIAAGMGGAPAVAGDLARGALGGFLAEKVQDTTGSETAGNVAEIAANLAPTAAVAITRRAFRNGAGQLTIADELRDRAITGVDTGVGPATQGKTVPDLLQSTAEKIPGGTATISDFYKRTADAMRSAVDRFAGIRGGTRTGTPADPLLAGRKVQRGIENFAVRVQRRMTRLEQAIGMPPRAAVELTSTRAALERIGGGATGIPELDMLSTTPAAAAAARQARASGTWQPVEYNQAIRLRSLIGAKIANAGLIADVPRGELKQLYGALSDDIGAAIQQRGGPDAFARFAQSRRYWEREITRIDDTLERISERIPIDRIVETVQRSPQTLAVLRRSLQPEEFDQVVSATFSQLGRATSANQNAAGEVFSLETFLTNWDRLGKPARAVLLGGERYREVRQGLEAVARQTERMREIQGRIRNPSQTARGLAGNAMIGAVATSVATGQLWPAVSAALAAAGSYGAARVMTSPDFLRWLAKSTTVPPAQLPGMAARLTGMIASGDYDPDQAAIMSEIAIRIRGKQGGR